MAGVLDFLDALLPSQVSIWFSSLFSYKKTYKTAEELQFQDLMNSLSSFSRIKSELLNSISSEKPCYILLITVPEAKEFVDGQIIGLNQRYKSAFVISDECINALELPASTNGNYKVIFNNEDL